MMNLSFVVIGIISGLILHFGLEQFGINLIII